MRTFLLSPDDAAVRFTRRLGALTLLGATLAAAAACSAYDSKGGSYGGPTDPPGPVVSIVSGAGAITANVAEYRTLLGDPLNGVTVGQQPAGRREINWDAVPAAVTNTNTFSGFFFNSNSPRGAVMTTPGTGFRVSDNDFGDITTADSIGFNAFSPTKTFAPVGSNVMDVTFQVAGSPTPAAVTGFGAVFSDVDVAGATKMELFDKDGRSLGVYPVPVRTDAAGLSFLGVKYDSPIVARVRITSGQGAIAANQRDVTDGGNLDLVVMDDFLYGEPKAIGQ
ncbi:MAG TPA: hypothetical protein VKA84_19270 [Gemmatimonadaceae bacterium]|nr:hypothetical protein [Gemmatimonadaceae bacterium]